MAQTFQQLQKQIEMLQAKAEQIRRGEFNEVVAKIKVAIEAYGISRQDLFGSGAGSGKAAQKQKGRGAAKSGAAKYSDGKGNSWVGRGKRPQWLRDALAAGGKLEDFLGAAGSSAADTGPGGGGAAPAKKRSAGKGGKAQYRDGAGNVWSGRGPRPRWLKDAISAGKTLDELRA